MDKPENNLKQRSWGLEDRPQRAESAFRRYGDEGWVVHLNNPANTLLNDAGARIFEMLDGRHSVAEMAEIVHEEFHVGLEQAQQDVTDFLAELDRNQMLA